jgi:hypothetical protein
MIEAGVAPMSALGRWATLLALGIAVATPTAALAQQKPFRINSISFPLIGSDYLDDHPGWTPIPTVIEQLKALGANEVKVTVTVAGYKSPGDNLPDAARTAALRPSDAKVTAFLQQLRNAGFAVVLWPFVSIDFDPNGNLLDTAHSQPADFTAWIDAHTADMVHIAQLAQQAGVERLIVLDDIVQPSTFAARNQDGWLSMLAQIRGVYTGSLTSALYADGTIFAGGNNHIDLTPRSIIDALDILGVGFMPIPLTSKADPTPAELVAAWRRNAKGVDSIAFLEGLHDKYGKPIYLTDVSFHSFAGDNVRSNDIYDATIPLVADQQEQANEYDSFLYVMSQNQGDWLLGVSPDSWNRFPPNWNTARFLDSQYGENIQGKLAESVLSEWYNGIRTSPGATPVFEYYNAALDHYFITWLPDEIAKLDDGMTIKGWARTGKSFPAYMAPKAGSSPVCRFYIPPGLGDSHFFGRGTDECDATAQKYPALVLEDAAFMHMQLPVAGVCPAGTTEVYRVFDNRPDANHRYMTDKTVRAQMVAKGWIAEGDGPNLVVMCAGNG